MTNLGFWPNFEGGGVRMGVKGPTCYMVYSVGVKCAKNIPKPYNRAQVLWGGGRVEQRFSLKPKSVLFLFEAFPYENKQRKFNKFEQCHRWQH